MPLVKKTKGKRTAWHSELEKDSLADFAVNLTNMHFQAHKLGLHETGHALHAAVQKVGFEIAETRLSNKKIQNKKKA